MFKVWKPEPNMELIQRTYETLMKSYLLGMVHAARGRRAGNNRFNSLPFDEAMEWAANRISLSPSDYSKLSDHMKLHAFTVGRLAQLDQIENARKAYLKSLKTGPDTDSFISFMSKDDQDARFAKYYELVYRTNIQTDYNAGRAKQLSADPPVALQFIGIEDDRQSEVCKACSGIILPYTDPWWDTHWPPLHYKCRSTIRAIYDYEAEAMGLMTKDGFRQQKKESLGQYAAAGNPKPQGTFGANPIRDNQLWKVTPSQYSRIAKSMIQDEINGVAGQTVCKDFQRDVPGYVNVKTEKGGLRYPKDMEKDDEFIHNRDGFRKVADKFGYYIEMRRNPSGGSALPFNPSSDAWLNGIEKIDLKNFIDAGRSTMSEEIKRASEQAQSVVCILHHRGQIDKLYKAFAGRIPAMKEQGRQFTRAIVIFGDRGVELSWDELQDNGILLKRLTELRE